MDLLYADTVLPTPFYLIVVRKEDELFQLVLVLGHSNGQLGGKDLTTPSLLSLSLSLSQYITKERELSIDSDHSFP